MGACELSQRIPPDDPRLAGATFLPLGTPSGLVAAGRGHDEQAGMRRAQPAGLGLGFPEGNRCNDATDVPNSREENRTRQRSPMGFKELGRQFLEENPAPARRSPPQMPDFRAFQDAHDSTKKGHTGADQAPV